MKIGDKQKLGITGIIIGIAAVVLVALGNPKNMGFCIACFIRDTAGALHLHTAPIVEYVRPEIIGIILGSFAISVIGKDFRPKGGSSPVLRFVIGFIVMIGALVFLGCPLRMVLRLGGGDLNALVGLLGFIAGIAIGCVFLANGFTLGKAERQSAVEGTALPFATVLLFVCFLAFPSLFLFSETGPGAMRAPVAAALLAGLIVGVAAERTRLCMAGGIRDIFLVRDYTHRDFCCFSHREHSHRKFLHRIRGAAGCPFEASLEFPRNGCCRPRFCDARRMSAPSAHTSRGRFIR